MKSGLYRSGQAARVWAISPHLVRRLCEAGLIRAERSNTGQWKIPHTEVERIRKDGVPEIPSSVSLDLISNEQKETTCGNTQFEPQSDGWPEPVGEPATGEEDGGLQFIEDNQPKRALFRDDSGEAKVQVRKPTVPLVRPVQVQGEQERIAWHDSWMATALRSLPPDAPPEIPLLLRGSVSDVLANLGPQHSWIVVEPLVNAAVAKVLRPWNLEKETARAVEMACGTLPWEARDVFSPTTWQSRAQRAASTAIANLPPGSPFCDKVRAASVAVREISSEFEDAELRRRTIQGAQLTDIDWGERENAKEAIRRKLDSLPIGTNALVLQNASEQALAPFRESQKRSTRVNLALRHVRPYLERLYQEGETDFDSTWAIWKFAERLEGRFRPILVSELQNEDLTDEELSELVEDLVDEELE